MNTPDIVWHTIADSQLDQLLRAAEHERRVRHVIRLLDCGPHTRTWAQAIAKADPVHAEALGRYDTGERR